MSDPNYTLERISDALVQIARTLASIEQALRPTGTAVAVEFYLKTPSGLKKVESMFIKVDEKIELSVAFKDRLGNLAKVDGAPAWALTDESLGKLEVAADGLSAVFTPVAVGALKLQCKADADLGEGVKEIIGELEVDISPLEAEKVEIAAVVSKI